MQKKLKMNKMKSIKKYGLLVISVIAIGISVTLNSCTTDETQTVTTLTNLVMEEEFETSGAPDPEMWTYDIGTGENGWGNNELQYYTDRAENVVVDHRVARGHLPDPAG